MKIMKKALAGLLSLAVVVGACFAFTGCNSVKNKTYAMTDFSLTIVKAVDENGKVTETQTLATKQAYMFLYLDIELDQLESYTMTEDEEKEYNESLKDMANSMLRFTADAMFEVEDTKNEISGEIQREETEYTYEVKDGVITATQRTDYDEKTLDARYHIVTLNIVDKKIERREYAVSEDNPATVGQPYYMTAIYSVVK